MLSRLKRLTLPTWTYPLVLLGLAILAYGVLIPWLGFYWDEWPLTWIGHRLGAEGLERYFSTNRPFWGLLYRFSMPLLGDTPWHWQLFGLFWRWLTAVLFWGVLHLAFPHRRDLAGYAGILFLLYPGFSQQSTAFMYGHFFIIFSIYLGSLLSSLAAVTAWPTNTSRYILLTALALVLSLANLLAMEYFFLLELLRPLFISAALKAQETAGDQTAQPPPAMRRKPALLLSIPYLILFAAAAAWRAFFFPYQTQNYETGLLGQVTADPFGRLFALLGTVLQDLYQTTLGALLKAYTPPDPSILGTRTILVWAAVTSAAGLLCFAGLLLLRRSTSVLPQVYPKGSALPFIRIAVPALLLAGVPFWMTQLPIHPGFPYDRFMLPFMPGFALLVAGLLGLLPRRRLWGQVALIFVVITSGLAAGLHFQEASAYRRDWNQQRVLFWQMSWRIPGLEPGTTLIASDMPLHYYSDNSLTGPLNWVYAPENRTSHMDYMFYYASQRYQRKFLFREGQAIQHDYLASTFSGSMDQTIALVFNPPACLRILDPDLDPLNFMISDLMRQASDFTSYQWILAPDTRPDLDLTPAIFDAEPAHSWCYYYEKAAYAASIQDWPTVVSLGDTAFSLGDYPNDPMERVPFIEGYAHTGNWPRALELSQEASRITPLMQPILCRLWQRIEEQTPASPAKSSTLSQARLSTCK